MKKITLFIFLCIFMLFRPYQLQNSGMIYSGDDDSYLAHATSLAYFQFPSYEKEFFSAGKGVPMHSIGPALLAFPFVFSASILDRISGNEIAIERKATNIRKSWTAFGFTISTIFYFWLTCFFLYKGLTYYFSPQISSLTVILTVLAQGVPLFSLRRPVFPHIYEIFLQSFLLFLLLHLLKYGGGILPGKKLRDIGEAIFVGLLIGLVSLVRINNIPISLAWPIVLFSLYHPKLTSVRFIKMVMVSYLSMTVLIFIFLAYPILYLHNINQYEGYATNEFVQRLLILHNPLFYVKRLVSLFLGFDWGLIFTAPYILLGLFALAKFNKNRIYSCLKWLLVPLTVNLYVTLAFGEQGGWYGHRYLIFSLIPIIAYPLAKLISMSKSKSPFFYYAIILISISPVLSMLSFEANNSNLTLTVIDQGFGFIDWGNNNYQLEIYKTILTEPIQYLIGILKGGLLYFVYLLFTVLGFKQYLPVIVFEKYTILQLDTFIKTAVVYLFPLVLLLVYKKVISRCKKHENVQAI